MSTFVLVHGAWQTASSWDLTVPDLRAAGHTVCTPMLTGLENRDAELSDAIRLQTHIEDVTRALERENLYDVTLVGHSYAGMVITGVAEHAFPRLRRLVYVDAFVPDDGQSALDLMPAGIADLFRSTAADGWLLRSGEGHLDLWGLKTGAARDFVRSRLSDFSLRCFEEAIRLPANAASRLDRSYIACVAEAYPARAVFQRFSDRARQENWHCHELPTGHDCHVEMPIEFVEKLLASEALLPAHAG